MTETNRLDHEGTWIRERLVL